MLVVNSIAVGRGVVFKNIITVYNYKQSRSFYAEVRLKVIAPNTNETRHQHMRKKLFHSHLTDCST